MTRPLLNKQRNVRLRVRKRAFLTTPRKRIRTISSAEEQIPFSRRQEQLPYILICYAWLRERRKEVNDRVGLCDLVRVLSSRYLVVLGTKKRLCKSELVCERKPAVVEGVRELRSRIPSKRRHDARGENRQPKPTHTSRWVCRCRERKTCQDRSFHKLGVSA